MLSNKREPIFFSHLSVLVAILTISLPLGEAFVNLKPVRKQQLQSTSTPTTYEPVHILTDAYVRNPFESLDEDGRDIAGEDWFSMIPKQPKLLADYLQSERHRQHLQRNLRVSLHNVLRDSGALRAVMDFLVTIGTPSLALDHPDIVPLFWELTREKQWISYGQHKQQGIDMFLPKNVQSKGLLFFVHGKTTTTQDHTVALFTIYCNSSVYSHSKAPTLSHNQIIFISCIPLQTLGGAWGSGMPWMYRLVARPFLEKGFAVAIVGYRTFPDGDVTAQVEDLEMAAQALAKQFPEFSVEDTDYGVCMMGHSSGAHISMQMVVNRICGLLKEDRPPTSSSTIPTMRIDSFIGLSAPYEIASHYEFETRRGLEELSPMKAACGSDKKKLSNFSPILQLNRMLVNRTVHERLDLLSDFPRVAMYHGIQDDTVPISSTRQAALLLRSLGISQCEETYFGETGHSDTVFELMFGGKTKDSVFEWFESFQTRLERTELPRNRRSSMLLNNNGRATTAEKPVSSKGKESEVLVGV